MLMLCRNIGQEIYIGNDIRIVIVDVHGKQVRIGIDAPREIRVVRKEIIDNNRNRREKQNVTEIES